MPAITPGPLACPQPMDVCTIIAKNYAAQARVLARSLAEQHPDARMSVLVIDDIEGYIDPAHEPFRVLTVADIACEPFAAMSASYSVLELSTAVKPWLLRFLLDEGSPAVLYLDPDIRIYGSLARLDELAREQGLVLTPHNLSPLLDDGEIPTQLSVLVAGVNNLGFLGIARTDATDALIEWWAGRLERYCRVDPKEGYFVDQRWFDLAPGFVPSCAIVREPQYNVAYWNLQSREVASSNGGYTVDGHALAFFHFSGFDPGQPQLLSRFQTRVKLSEQPALAELCRAYADDVMREGFEETSRWPYTYGTLPDGTPYTRGLRVLRDRAMEEGAVIDSPFSEAGFEQLLGWLAVWPPGAPAGFNRLLAYAYSAHAELRAAFPDLGGADRERLIEFATSTSEYDLALVGVLARRGMLATQGGGGSAGSDATQRRGPAPPWGVNMVGYFHSELGPGIAARAVAAALDIAGIPLLPADARAIPVSHERHPFACITPPQSSLAVSLFAVAPDATPELAGAFGEEFFARRPSIGLWLSSSSRFPERRDRAFELLDELWVPSRYLAQALGAVAPIPVSAVTIPILAEPSSPATREQLGLPDGFLFLCSLDHAEAFERKNPLGLIEAFASAFAPGDGAALVIKCLNERDDMASHELLRLAAGEHPDVHVVAGYRPRAEQRSLLGACDCYVSLHRLEPLGLGIAEAMALGKPAIATGYSGNLDFMTPANSLLVDHALVPVGDVAATAWPALEWAEPDLAHASKLMRSVFEDQALSQEIGRRGAADLRRTHSAQAAGALLAERLAELHSKWQARSGTADGPPALGSLPALLDEPASDLHVSRRSPRALARTAVLRAMKQYMARQDAINAAVREALTQIQPQLLRLDRRQAALEARLAEAEGDQPTANEAD